MLANQPIDGPYQPAASAGRQMAGANSTQGGYQPPGYLQYQPTSSATAKPQQAGAPGDTGQTGGPIQAQKQYPFQQQSTGQTQPQTGSKTPMGASQTVPPPQGAPAVGTNGQSATSAPMPNAQGPAANGGQNGANGQAASIANMGSTIDAQLQNPNPYNSANVQQIYNNQKADLTTELNQQLAATDANAASRGLYYSTAATDPQSWQRAQYQRALSNLGAQMTQMSAQGQLQGQGQANAAALGFMGQAQNADALQLQAATNAAEIGLMGGPTAQTAMYGSAFMPSPDFGSVYPQAFSALGSMFANQPNNAYSPYGYNPTGMNGQYNRYAPAGGSPYSRSY